MNSISLFTAIEHMTEKGTAKVRVSGSRFSNYYVGTFFSYSENNGNVDLAVDGNGAMYISKVQKDSISGAATNVVAK